MVDFFNRDTCLAFIEHAVRQYEKSAPTVAAYLEALYIRLNKEPKTVVVSELVFLPSLYEEAIWMHPNYAANAVYKLQTRLGQDTAGHFGF